MRTVLLLLAAPLVSIACRAPSVRMTPPPVPMATEPRLLREPSAPAHATSEKLVFHSVRLDAGGLVAWPDTDSPYDHILRLGMHFFVGINDSPKNGKPVYWSSSMYKPQPDGTIGPGKWLFNPAGLSAMLVRTSLRWWLYSGDRLPLERAQAFVDHLLENGRSELGDAWSHVPFASGNVHELTYHGGDESKYCDDQDPLPCGRGDGTGNLEPDKVAEVGYALVLLHRATGEVRYLEAARACADALAKHVQPGDALHSPWPFRVDAATGAKVREPYTSNILPAVQLFDAFEGMGTSNDGYRRARKLALDWLLAFPVKTMHWQGYFEDIPIYEQPGTNPNQYSAGEMARFLLDHPEVDPDSRTHARAILDWIAKTFTVDVDAPVGPTPGHWHGAEVLSEQGADMAKMGSHTARFASVLARLYEVTGEASLRERARRSFAWATYCTDQRGVVKVGPDDREGYWFSDGYGDYFVHFLDGMAAVPAWAPHGEAHVLRASSVPKLVKYDARAIHLVFADDSTTAELVTPAPPTSVTLDGNPIDLQGKDVAATVALPDLGAYVRLLGKRGRDVWIRW